MTTEHQASRLPPNQWPRVLMVTGKGGVGKTTVAVALVNDEQVLASFDKIAWVSVGHKPDVEELHGSIYYQLTDQELPDNLKTNREIMGALHNAALGLRVLLVLDDVWDPAVEKVGVCAVSCRE